MTTNPTVGMDQDHSITLSSMQARTTGVVLRGIGHLLETVALIETWKIGVNSRSQHLAGFDEAVIGG